MKIAGLDIGTTGCKLTVFDGNGVYLDKAYQDYPVKRKSGEHEVDVEAIMDGVLSVMKEVCSRHPDIAGIGVTSFGETFVMADENGKPLHQAFIYTDPRGIEECRELEAHFGGRTLASITGTKPHEMYSISKMMWIKRNKPEIYEKAKHIFLMEDYVVYGLTGVAQIDYSLATRTMAFDITSLKWCDDIFDYAGIDKNLMSKPVPTGTPAGKILPVISEKTGLNPEAVIVSISHDQIAAAVGANVFDSSKAVDGAGTVECITPVYDEIPELDAMYDGNYSVVPYVIPGKYVCYAFSYTGGALVQWCLETLGRKEQEEAAEKGISVYDYLEGDTKEPTGLLVLPHFAGAATPYMDTGSKGAILGLSMSTTLSDIYRASMEGVVYEMVLNMEYLKKSGVDFKMLHATGGGAKSAVWMQMKADMLNVPVRALEVADAGTVGSAMLTGIAAGCFKDLSDAAAHMVREKQIYYPNAEMHKKYMKIYERYRSLYQAVRPLV